MQDNDGHKTTAKKDQLILEKEKLPIFDIRLQKAQ